MSRGGPKMIVRGLSKGIGLPPGRLGYRQTACVTTYPDQLTASAKVAFTGHPKGATVIGRN
eukprot:14021995-Alexandrium_andersonii.AAC.1